MTDKEVTIHLAEHVISLLTDEAEQRGITFEELVRYTLSHHIQSGPNAMVHMVKGMFGDLENNVKTMGKVMLKEKARLGFLTCSDCTMMLTMQDVEDGKCSHCGHVIEAGPQER